MSLTDVRAVERGKHVMSRDAGLPIGPDEGKVIQNPIGGRMVVKVGDEDTDGSYSVHDNIIPAGSHGPLPTSTAIMRRPSTSSRGT
jgi:hypothetical protein